MNDITTTDFTQFGYREREMAEDLLHAWNENGLPEDFDSDQVTIMFNKNSGNVFLTNSEFQVAMITDDNKLESFYNCVQCGNEGFDGDEFNFKQHNGYCSQECEDKNK